MTEQPRSHDLEATALDVPYRLTPPAVIIQSLLFSVLLTAARARLPRVGGTGPMPPPIGRSRSRSPPRDEPLVPGPVPLREAGLADVPHRPMPLPRPRPPLYVPPPAVLPRHPDGPPPQRVELLVSRVLPLLFHDDLDLINAALDRAQLLVEMLRVLLPDPRGLRHIRRPPGPLTSERLFTSIEVGQVGR